MVYWFILLFPFLIYPWGIERYYTNIKFIYLELFVVLTWLSIIIKRKSWEVNLKKPYFSIELIVFVFLCLVGFSTIFSVNQYASIYGRLGRHEGLLTFLCYGSILLFSYRLMTIKQIEKIIPGMAIVSIFVSTYGILQHYFLDFLPRTPLYYNEIRSYSFFDNPNFFGSYLVLVIMLTISIYLTAKTRILSAFYLTTIGLAFVSLIFSGTRSGWVGVFCGLIFVSFIVILKRKYLWKKWIVLLMTLFLLMVAINFAEKGALNERAMTLFSDSYRIATQTSTGREGSFRLFIWKKSLPLVSENFWLGSGPDTFDQVFPNDEEKKQVFGDIIVDKAHNEYLQMAITLGVPALLVYLYLLLVVFKNAYFALKRIDGDRKIQLYGFLSAIFGYLVQAFFNISTVPVAPLFWAILGMTMALSTIYLKKEIVQNSIDVFSESGKKNKTA
ncbi:O-antigen ligase family protein [Neobacillus sp. LXY-4]|uniref:O-antigen ligase family protein n=1 Tax=Neobacillus sp. LXY-4 TaxID=3379826 RepID=UPI003EE1A693